MFFTSEPQARERSYQAVILSFTTRVFNLCLFYHITS